MWWDGNEYPCGHFKMEVYIWELDKNQKSHNYQTRNQAKVETYASFWVVERILGWIIKGYVDTQ